LFPRVPPLPFPPSLLQSRNFASGRSAPEKPLRLKNVTVVLDWLAHAGGGGADGGSGGRFTVIVSLAEAESLRCLIHGLNTQRRHDGNDAVGGVALALVLLPSQTVLDCTANYPAPGSVFAPAGADDAGTAMACCRFWDNDMFYRYPLNSTGSCSYSCTRRAPFCPPSEV
jgi:hypothetical protein